MSSKGILKLIGKLAILLAILFVCDRLVGMLLENLFYKQTHGDDVVSIQLIEKANEEILVMGSSRASHHYNAALLENATGMTCFNGGRDEMTITYSNAILPVIYKRYTPKVLVLDLTPSELTAASHGEVVYQRISTVLLPFSNRHKELLPTIALAGETEIWKSKVSHIYPYNSLIGSSVQNAFTNVGHHSIKGFEPIPGKIDTNYYKTPAMNFNVLGIVEPKLQAKLQNIVDIAKSHNTRLIAIISPFYFPLELDKNESYHTIKQMMETNGVEFYDFTHASPFLNNPTLFYDEVHLNDSGANIYTQTIANIINKKE
jgi:hypothetical protein